jgi:TRAP-type C4-dicarboxylate transport system substrate-binding protein
MYRPDWTVILLVALAVLTASCVGAEEVPPPKSGGDAEPRVLSMGTDDFPDRAPAEQIEEFARRVEELSDGQLRIEPVWRAGDGDPEWDQVVARKVISGELDLANVPSRAWDTEGVDSLRALNAPFLIATDELLDAVVTSDLADEMLAGLEGAGVVGLTLVPEGLRHPFGFEQPLLGPDDYRDGQIRAPYSATTRAMFEALGATTTAADTNRFTQIGMESAYPLDVQGSATGNVTFFPKIGTMVVNGDVFAGLSERHQQVLIEAAAQVRDWAIDTRTSDAEKAARFCEEGGTIVHASDAELAALVAAVAPAYVELEADPQTRTQIEAIRALAQDLASDATAAEPCGTQLAADADDPDEPDAEADNSAINGIYRWEFTRAELEAAGLPPDQVDGNVGVWTNWFQDGRWWDQDEPMGTYTLDGDLLIFDYGLGTPETFRWEQNARGDLLVTPVDVEPEWQAYAELWTDEPWLRVGDVD